MGKLEWAPCSSCFQVQPPAVWQPFCPLLAPAGQHLGGVSPSESAGRVSALPPVPRGMTGPLLVLAGSWGRLPRCGAGYYFTGDGAYRTEEGYYEITGRMDDVINISGHRLGTAEIEDAMVSTAAAGLGAESESVPHLCVFCPAQADHPAVPETAVIGYPHDIKGEGASSTLRPWGRGL